MTLILALALTVQAQAQTAASQTPQWLQQDIKAHASWLPKRILQIGLEATAQERFASLTQEAQATVVGFNIPSWMIALIPAHSPARTEINNHLRDAANPRGVQARSAVARRSEQLLLFAGAAQLPTPGDNRTGRSLGPEGCTAAITKYVLSQLALEFPSELYWFTAKESRIQASSELLKFLGVVANAPGAPIEIVRKPFHLLSASDVQPGSFMIAQKPGGAHSFGWTRVPSNWQWADSAKMAVANTGLPQFGQRMILAQEYIASETGEVHNEHGPINSNQVAKRNGLADLTSPKTNPYAVRGTTFIMIRFK